VTLAPLRLSEHGPARPWPQQDDPGQSRDDPGRWRAVDGDTAIRVLAAIVVLAVAAFGAIVSYSHIFTLGHAHGQDGTAARLLPLSVDGLIAAASLVMLHAARRKLPVPRLARAMLVTGVIATVAANVLDGLPPAWIGPVVSALIGAVVSAWPAVAFIGCAEMVVQFVRDARHDGASGDATPAATGGNGDKPRAAVRPPLATEGRRRQPPGRDKSALSVEEEAARDGVSAGAVRRRRQRARKAAAAKTS